MDYMKFCSFRHCCWWVRAVQSALPAKRGGGTYNWYT